jgi:hypothetical protein
LSLLICTAVATDSGKVQYKSKIYKKKIRSSWRHLSGDIGVLEVKLRQWETRLGGGQRLPPELPSITIDYFQSLSITSVLQDDLGKAFF